MIGQKTILRAILLMLVTSLAFHSCKNKRLLNYNSNGESSSNVNSYDEAIALGNKTGVTSLIIEYMLVVPDLSMNNAG